MGVTIIRRPILTEKSLKDADSRGVYVFEVAMAASKPEIKEAIEKLFNVKVKKVRTLIGRGQGRFTRKGVWIPARKFKKAYVTLQEGHKINLIEGV